MTCKDCIHERVCFALIKKGLPYADGKLPAETFCLEFKNKADFVEVVRCGNCLNRIKGTYPKCAGRKSDDYCSDGIRKE